MYEALHQRTVKIEIIGETKFSIWYQHKNKFSHSKLDGVVGFFFFNFAVVTGIQMGEMSKLY
jgi:hypothetical protein